MYRQVYLHPVRRIYDIHLKDFLKAWLPEGYFPTNVEEHLGYTDNEVMSAMYRAARQSADRAHELARRVMLRHHFKLVYARSHQDLDIHLQADSVIFEEVKRRFGADLVRRDTYTGKKGAIDFPVLTREDDFISSLQMSETLQKTSDNQARCDVRRSQHRRRGGPVVEEGPEKNPREHPKTEGGRMKPLAKRALIIALLERMKERGSWCGETHIQKGVYVCQEGLGVPLAYDFILYKHGPFSFDLRKDLGNMEADRLLETWLRPYPYGPSLSPGPLAGTLLEQFPKTVARYSRQLNFIADHLAQRGVVELERLTTALYVGRELRLRGVKERVDTVRRLKPHIAPDEALEAVRSVDEFLKRADKEAVHSLES